MSNAPTPPEPPAGGPTIHEASLAGGPSGAVLRGAVIDVAAAVARRQGGLDVVVCGDDVNANRRLAETIESAVGPWKREDPHKRHAGPLALPHFQQTKRRPPPPRGHAFYETAHRKTRSGP